jgi:hypothetical protein
MNYDTFQELVLDLILFWQSQCFNLVKPQVKIKNIFAIFLIDSLIDIMPLM